MPNKITPVNPLGESPAPDELPGRRAGAGVAVSSGGRVATRRTGVSVGVEVSVGVGVDVSVGTGVRVAVGTAGDCVARGCDFVGKVAAAGCVGRTAGADPSATRLASST